LADSLVSQGYTLLEQQRWGPARKLYCEAHEIYEVLGVSSLAAAMGHMWAAVHSPESLMTYRGHEHAVTCVDLSADYRLAISGSAGGEVKVWDVASGREMLHLSGHSSGLIGTNFLRGQNRAVSASSDGRIVLWDVVTGQQLKVFDNQGREIRAIAVLPDGDRILYAFQNPDPPGRQVDGSVAKLTRSTLVVFNLETAEEELRFKHEGRVFALAIAADGNRVLVGTFDATTYISLKPSKVICRLSGSMDVRGHALLYWWSVECVGFSHSGKRAIVGCSDGVLEYWDLETTQQTYTQKHKVRSIYTVAATPSGTELFGCGEAFLWSRRRGFVCRNVAGLPVYSHR